MAIPRGGPRPAPGNYLRVKGIQRDHGGEYQKFLKERGIVPGTFCPRKAEVRKNA